MPPQKYKTTSMRGKQVDRAMVYMPGQGKEACTAISWTLLGDVEVSLIDHPQEPPIFVSLSRVQRYYEEMGDHSWTGPRKKQKQGRRSRTQGPLNFPTPSR